GERGYGRPPGGSSRGRPADRQSLADPRAPSLPGLELAVTVGDGGSGFTCVGEQPAEWDHHLELEMLHPRVAEVALEGDPARSSDDYHGLRHALVYRRLAHGA